MLSFECDYNNGAHPKVLQHLLETNGRQSLTYGFDEWTEQAKDKIRMACEAPDAQIWFLAGGTQTNATVIDGILDHYQAVITTETGHINVHEAGAIEFCGHRVISLPSHEGLMDAKDLDAYMQWFVNDESSEHLAQPGMVYITYPSELGTIDHREQLAAIYEVCQNYDLKLYVDGARLGYGLMAEGADITLPWLSAHCDAFYIGGTKVGALCGEAVVFPRGNAPKHFFSIIKQHGALMAKGRLIGLQFDALFTDGLYLEISRHAIDMAMRMKELFRKKGWEFYLDSPTNQQFVILPNEVVAKLEKQVQFTHWEPVGDTHFLCRFVTSWATTEEEFEALSHIIQNA
jgi:threonine aldolase